MVRKVSRVTGPDGHVYLPEKNEELDELLLATFGSGAGAQALAYLRSITLETIGGPHITNDELRHREGGRYLIAIIEARMNAARQRKEKKQ